jgi:DNA-binding NarL/FixJ family response regulator
MDGVITPRTTKVLFLESDDASFQVKKCVAKVLSGLPPVEFYQARDASEALSLLNTVHPDVVVIDEESDAERDLFMESVGRTHPPVVVTRDGEQTQLSEFSLDNPVTYLPRTESLEAMHQTLVLITALGIKSANNKSGKVH